MRVCSEVGADVGRVLAGLAIDLVRFLTASVRSRTALAVANPSLRKQLALYRERQVKPRCASDLAPMTDGSFVVLIGSYVHLLFAIGCANTVFADHGPDWMLNRASPASGSIISHGAHLLGQASLGIPLEGPLPELRNPEAGGDGSPLPGRSTGSPCGHHIRQPGTRKPQARKRGGMLRFSSASVGALRS